MFKDGWRILLPSVIEFVSYIYVLKNLLTDPVSVQCNLLCFLVVIYLGQTVAWVGGFARHVIIIMFLSILVQNTVLFVSFN